jgi:hypothetical protein
MILLDGLEDRLLRLLVRLPVEDLREGKESEDLDRAVLLVEPEPRRCSFFLASSEGGMNPLLTTIFLGLIISVMAQLEFVFPLFRG